VRNFSSKLAPVIKEYLEHRSTLGYSDFQERSLEMFDAYCHEHYPDTETITREIVREWINFETSRGFTGMYNRVPAVRLLAQYMGNGAYILPPKSLPPPKPCRPYILSDDELSRLFAAADNINGNFDDSVKLMFPTLLRLQYTCGLRPYEVRSIEQKHIDLNTGEILITKSKKHRERIVVMSDDTLKQCRKYDGIKKVFAPKSEYFFVRYDNTPISSLKLWLVFNRCWQQANPDIPANMLPRVRPYDLRHRFASAILQKWLDYGKDLYAMLPYLQAYMGHENFSHTAYYIHLLPENLLNSAGVDWSLIDGVNPEVEVWEN
jgi:integrase